MQHEKRKFVNKVYYLTTPGHLTGSDGRKRAGLAPGRPITNMAVIRFDDETKEMYLAGYYPRINKEEILENMEFKVDVSGRKRWHLLLPGN